MWKGLWGGVAASGLTSERNRLIELAKSGETEILTDRPPVARGAAPLAPAQ